MEIVKIPVQQSEPIEANAVASPKVNVEPALEHPYVYPPLIPGYKEGDLLFSELAPAPVEPLPTGKPAELPPVPNPSSLPVLEQKPDVPVLYDGSGQCIEKYHEWTVLQSR